MDKLELNKFHSEKSKTWKYWINGKKAHKYSSTEQNFLNQPNQSLGDCIAKSSMKCIYEYLKNKLKNDEIQQHTIESKSNSEILTVLEFKNFLNRLDDRASKRVGSEYRNIKVNLQKIADWQLCFVKHQFTKEQTSKIKERKYTIKDLCIKCARYVRNYMKEEGAPLSENLRHLELLGKIIENLETARQESGELVKQYLQSSIEPLSREETEAFLAKVDEPVREQIRRQEARIQARYH